MWDLTKQPTYRLNALVGVEMPWRIEGPWKGFSPVTFLLGFFTTALLLAPNLAQAGYFSWSCTAYTTCTYCAETCNACSNTWVQDPAYPKTVTTLPLNFDYSRADDNTANDVCSSDCGTKYCNAGITAYSNQTLPATSSACTLSDPTRLPHTLNCSYQDGMCYSYCTRTESYSCCAAWTSVWVP